MTVYTASTTGSNSAVQQNCALGKSPATGGVVTVDPTIYQIGSHGSGDNWVMGARFNAVTETSISAASFSMMADSTYAPGAGVIEFKVSCQAADDAAAFTAVGDNDLESGVRARTTADTTWVQTSVTGGTRYSVDITSAVQEVLARGGWVSGNDIVVLVDTHTTTATGEWQDYRDGATGGEGVQLDLTASGGTKAPPTPRAALPMAVLAR